MSIIHDPVCTLTTASWTSVCKQSGHWCVQTRAKYLSVGKNMKLYEDTKYEMWKEHVEQVLPSLLKRNLLIKPAVSAAMAMHASHVPEETGDDVGKWRFWSADVELHLPCLFVVILYNNDQKYSNVLLVNAFFFCQYLICIILLFLFYGFKTCNAVATILRVIMLRILIQMYM